MGPKPPGHEIDRVDPERDNYGPDTCRWIIRSSGRRRTDCKVLYRGQEMYLADAVVLAGSIVTPMQARVRMREGWGVARALETPPNPPKCALISASKNKGKPHPKVGPCPHCGIYCSVSTFTRWHGDNCKQFVSPLLYQINLLSMTGVVIVKSVVPDAAKPARGQLGITDCMGRI